MRIKKNTDRVVTPSMFRPVRRRRGLLRGRLVRLLLIWMRFVGMMRVFLLPLIRMWLLADWRGVRLRLLACRRDVWLLCLLLRLAATARCGL